MKLFLATLILFPAIFHAQLAPFIDFNNFFKTFYKGTFRQLEFQPIKSFEATDNFCVYIDYRADFKLYDGEKVQTLTNQNVVYKASDGQLAWTIGTGLFCMSDGKKELLTVFANRFDVTDSLIIFEDTRFNTLNYRYKNQNNMLVKSTGELLLPVKTGDNTIVFKDNGDFIKFMWRNTIYDYNVYTKAITFECGMDVICFNDPINQTFTVFDKGEFIDLETMFVSKYQAARGFVVYEDIQGNLWQYKNGEKFQLNNFSARKWEAKDDLIVWEENNYIFTLVNGEKKQIISYIPQDYKMKNATMAFRNSMGGVSVFSNGKVEEITKQSQSDYWIYGNTVLVQLFNKSYIVYSNGEKFEL